MCHSRCLSLCNIFFVFITIARLNTLITGSHSSIGELHASESISSIAAHQNIFKCPQKFGYFRHANHCDKYYICSFGIAFPKNCTAGLHFSVTLQICDWPINALCDNDNNNDEAFDSMYNYRIEDDLFKKNLNHDNYETIVVKEKTTAKPVTVNTDTIKLKPLHRSRNAGSLINSGSNIKSTLVKPNGYYVIKSINKSEQPKSLLPDKPVYNNDIKANNAYNDNQNTPKISSTDAKLISSVVKTENNEYIQSRAQTPRSTAKPLTQLMSSINTEDPNPTATTEPINYYKSELGVENSAYTSKPKMISSFTRTGVTNSYNTVSDRIYNEDYDKKLSSNQNQRPPLNGSDNLFVFVKPLNEGFKLVKKLVKIKKTIRTTTTKMPEFQNNRKQYEDRKPTHTDEYEIPLKVNPESIRLSAGNSERNQTGTTAQTDLLKYQRQRMRQQKYFRKISRTPRVKSWSHYNNDNKYNDDHNRESPYSENYRDRTNTFDANNFGNRPEIIQNNTIVINDNTNRQLKLIMKNNDLRSIGQQQQQRRTSPNTTNKQKAYETVSYIPAQQQRQQQHNEANNSRKNYNNEDYLKYDTSDPISKEQEVSVKINENIDSANNLTNELNSWMVSPINRLSNKDKDAIVVDTNQINRRHNSYMDFLGFANSPKLQRKPIKIIELEMQPTTKKPQYEQKNYFNYQTTNIFNKPNQNITAIIFQPDISKEFMPTTPYYELMNTKILNKPRIIENQKEATTSTTSTTPTPTEMTISTPNIIGNRQEMNLFKPIKTTQTPVYYSRHGRIYEKLNTVKPNDSSSRNSIDSDNKSETLTRNSDNIYNHNINQKINPYSDQYINGKRLSNTIEPLHYRNDLRQSKTTPKPRSSVNYVEPTKKRFKYKPKFFPTTTTTTTTTTTSTSTSTEAPIYDYYYEDDYDTSEKSNGILSTTKIPQKSFKTTTTTPKTTTTVATEKPYYDYYDDYKIPINNSSEEFTFSKVTATSTTTTTTTTTTTQKPSTLPSIYSRKARPTNKRLIVKDVSREPPKPASRPKPIHPTPMPLIGASKCDSKKCKVPDCRCGGSDIPEEYNTRDIPQIVMITFDDAVNDLNWEIYEQIFSERFNPNGCPIRGTFYVSHEWTDYGKVQTLYSRGHEIASHGITHSFGENFSTKEWVSEINGQREILHLYGGVKFEDIRGMRAPFLQTGGNHMFEMLYETNFTYDSSLPVSENNPPFFPYTLDYALNHHCMIPPCPTKSFPGVWEVGMTMWQDLRGGRCSMGDACTNPSDELGVYDMLLKNFNRHYKSNRAPFGLYYHSAWFNTQHHRKGFLKFLDETLQKNDVYFITNWQMIQWMRDPTPVNRIGEFHPWKCDSIKANSKSVACNHPSICNVNSKNGARQLRTCQPCPSTYPWLGSTGFEGTKFA